MKFINLYNILLESRLDDYKLQLKDDQLAQNIFNIKNPKKQKMIIKWIKNNSIKYPKDIDIIDKVYQIINRKQLDYNNYNSPQQILDQYQQLSNRLQYNPDEEPCFTNRTQLGKGVVVYNVQDDFEGLMATRKAVDYNWGKDSNPWCLVTPPLKSEAFQHWTFYSSIPKRICFQNNKLIAFCANNTSTIYWWDRNDKPTTNIPIEGVEDDPNAIKEVQQFKKVCQDSKTSNNPKRLQWIYQNYKNNKIIKINFGYNPNISYIPLDIIQELIKDEDYVIRQTIAKNKNTPSNILQKLSDDEVIDVKIGLVENPNCPSDILQKLLKEKSTTIKRYIAKNPNTPIKILQKLSNDIDHIIRGNVAKNKNCPIQILQKLSNDGHQWVRRDVISNPKTPLQILKKLSKDVNLHVRSDLAKNPQTPAQILQILSNDIDKFVRYNVALNPNTPSFLVKKIKI